MNNFLTTDILLARESLLDKGFPNGDGSCFLKHHEINP